MKPAVSGKTTKIPWSALEFQYREGVYLTKWKSASGKEALRAMLHAIESAIGARRAVSWEYKQPERQDVFSPRQPEEKPQAQDAPSEKAAPPDWTQEAIRRMAQKRAAQQTEGQKPEPQKPALPPIDDGAVRSITLPSRQTSEETLLRQNLAAEQQVQAEPLFDEQPLVPYRIIGQIFATYILVEQGDNLFLMDQHAAHERILFDQLTKTTQALASQQLLFPQDMALTPAEAAVLAENEPFVRQLGFEFSRKPGGWIALTAFPCILMEAEGPEFLRETLSALSEQTGEVSAAALKKDAVALMACKAAIKGNSPLSEREIQMLLAQFGQLGVLNCPHGRPIVVKVTKYQLEKLFRRIV